MDRCRKVIASLLMMMFWISACGAPAPAAEARGSAACGGTAEALTPQAGGEIVVAYKDDLATLDPAIGVRLDHLADHPKWSLIGLLGYDSGTTLEPRIAAEMPTVSEDGLVYTFKIRPGVKFSNGREVTADHAVYTLTC
jgi:peptide/nickel transport system substrate-binding protein